MIHTEAWSSPETYKSPIMNRNFRTASGQAGRRCLVEGFLGYPGA